MEIYRSDVVREDMQAIGATEQDARDGEMTKDVLLWQPLMHGSSRKKKKTCHSFASPHYMQEIGFVNYWRNCPF